MAPRLVSHAVSASHVGLTDCRPREAAHAAQPLLTPTPSPLKAKLVSSRSNRTAQIPPPSVSNGLPIAIGKDRYLRLIISGSASLPRIRIALREKCASEHVTSIRSRVDRNTGGIKPAALDKAAGKRSGRDSAMVALHFGCRSASDPIRGPGFDSA